jgi:hypothetical protein
MYIEDLISASKTINPIKYNMWDDKIITDFDLQISLGVGFTEKQSALAIKILKKYAPKLSMSLGSDISNYLENPAYKLPIREINTSKKMSVMDHVLYGRVISVIFPYNETYVTKIKEYKTSNDYRTWSKDLKSWIFSLTETNLKFLMDFAIEENFEISDEIAKLFSQAKEIISNMEHHIPMLVIEDKKPKIVNFDKNLPPLTSTEILPALFEARRRGVDTWDNTISNFLDSDEVDEITRQFLKSEPSEKFNIDSEIHGFSSLETIIKFMGPCLFVIPGGCELEKLIMAHEFLRSIGIENYQMSVMFRLPTESNVNFNNFVKNNGLNTPIKDHTQIVFISSKLPKPVLKSKIKFHAIINLGFDNVHYTMRDFVKSHENVIFYSGPKEKRNLQLVFM